MTQHQLALLGGLHHVAHRVNRLQALRIQNHTAHLFREAGERWPGELRNEPQTAYGLFGNVWYRSSHLPWQVTVISNTFLSISGVDRTALFICVISTFSMPSEKTKRRVTRSGTVTDTNFYFLANIAPVKDNSPNTSMPVQKEP